MEKENRQYKDTVFVDLFGEDIFAKENFISLYNALYGYNLPKTTAIQNVRLEQVLYTRLRNDISFLVENKLIILFEHQSTINENMPLRFLEYVARLYENFLTPKAKYSRNLIPIPTPEFFVFYNGVDTYPEHKTLHLSDAFIEKKTNIHLELTVDVYNINSGKNKILLERCKKLQEYSIFIETIRKYKKQNKETGFKKAIHECITQGILVEYLERKSREVVNMLVAEYDYATDIAVQREEAASIALLQGIEQGMQQGIEQGVLQTAQRMKQQGLDTSTIQQWTGLDEKTIEEL